MNENAHLKKHKYNWVPAFVYGSIDGIVTTFAVVSGVMGASLSIRIILILGFANLLGDGFSMGIAKYMSDKSERDYLIKSKQDHVRLQPVLGGFYTFVAFVLMGIIPLLSFIIGPLFDFAPSKIFLLTCIITLLALGIVGFVKASVDNTSKVNAVLQTVLLGGCAALIAFYVGFFVDQLLIEKFV